MLLLKTGVLVRKGFVADVEERADGVNEPKPDCGDVDPQVPMNL